MWQTTPFVQAKQIMPHDVIFDSCTHGGHRAKATLLRGNTLRDQVLSGSPAQKLYAQGARWPDQFSDQRGGSISSSVMSPHCRVFGLPEAPRAAGTLAKAMMQPETALSRMVLGALPRGKKAKPLVQEFGSYIALFTNEGDTNAAAPSLNTLPRAKRSRGRKCVALEENRVTVNSQRFSLTTSLWTWLPREKMYSTRSFSES